MKRFFSTLSPLRTSAIAILSLFGLATSAQTTYTVSDIFAGPWIFSGYRSLPAQKEYRNEIKPSRSNWDYNDTLRMLGIESLDSVQSVDSINPGFNSVNTDFEIGDADTQDMEEILLKAFEAEEKRLRTDSLLNALTILRPDYTPDWLRSSLTTKRMANNLMYAIMVNHPEAIEYAYWNLPEPPRLPDEDHSFSTYIKSLQLPEIDADKSKVRLAESAKRHWLHNAEAGIQFSQAYISANWYQGGNDYLALLLNGLWDVQLNKVYHPDLLFQSTVSYKLGLNSTPPDSYHKYSISEDLLQWNLKAGIKAFKDFFWSYNLLFKTQLLRNYESNSDTRIASFLSPGELNMGLGMSYSYANKYKTLKVGVSLSPISYNLKTCIDSEIDPTKFNIEKGHKAHNEIGTNVEANVEWSLSANISSRSRFFAFTNYQYFQSDLETTWNFQLNRFLSTQLYLHFRFDSSSELTGSRWKHWMLKEILSFGLSYTFSTKP